MCYGEEKRKLEEVQRRAELRIAVGVKTNEHSRDVTPRYRYRSDICWSMSVSVSLCIHSYHRACVSDHTLSAYKHKILTTSTPLAIEGGGGEAGEKEEAREQEEPSLSLKVGLYRQIWRETMRESCLWSDVAIYVHYLMVFL